MESLPERSRLIDALLLLSMVVIPVLVAWFLVEVIGNGKGDNKSR